jgi:mevalonate kinase
MSESEQLTAALKLIDLLSDKLEKAVKALGESIDINQELLSRVGVEIDG